MQNLKSNSELENYTLFLIHIFKFIFHVLVPFIFLTTSFEIKDSTRILYVVLQVVLLSNNDVGSFTSIFFGITLRSMDEKYRRRQRVNNQLFI